jgi:hypothetical protein
MRSDHCLVPKVKPVQPPGEQSNGQSHHGERERGERGERDRWRCCELSGEALGFQPVAGYRERRDHRSADDKTEDKLHDFFLMFSVNHTAGLKRIRKRLTLILLYQDTTIAWTRRS